MRSIEKTGKGGNIIYIGSLYSITSARLKAPYITAKHGLVGLCQAIAREGIDHGIRSNIIEPGFIRTHLLEKQIPEQAKALVPVQGSGWLMTNFVAAEPLTTA
jgi:3-hydroxybutyrate dehydrogenase